MSNQHLIASPVSASLRGTLFTLAATLFFALMDVCSKALLATLSPGALLGWRSALIAALLVLAFAVSGGFARLRLRAPNDVMPVATIRQLTFWRAMAMTGTSLFIILALRYLTLADAIAIYFVSPLFGALLGAVWLREPLPVRVLVACTIALVGVALIAKPFSGNLGSVPGWAYLFPLAAAITTGFQDILARRLRHSVDALTHMFYGMLASLLCGAVLAFLPSNPSPNAAWSSGTTLWLIGAALSGGGAFYCIVRALHYASPATLAPLRYLNLIWAALLGYLIWGETPDQWGLVGIVCILFAGVGTALMDAARK